MALRKTSKSLRLQEGKEKWESQMLKKRKASERTEIPVNVFTDNGADFEHEQYGEKEQGKVKNNSKKNKQVAYGSVVLTFIIFRMNTLYYKPKPVYLVMCVSTCVRVLPSEVMRSYS